MRHFWVAIAILCAIVLAVTVNTVAVARSIEKSKTDIQNIPHPDTSDEGADLSLQAALVEGARTTWQRKLRFLSLTIHHHDAMKVNEHLAALCGAAKANDAKAYVTTLAVLMDAFEHIEELNTPTLWNIL